MQDTSSFFEKNHELTMAIKDFAGGCSTLQGKLDTYHKKYNVEQQGMQVLKDELLPQLNSHCLKLLVCAHTNVSQDKLLLPRTHELLHKTKQHLACADAAFGHVEHAAFLEHTIAIMDYLPQLKDLKKPMHTKPEVHQVLRAFLTDDLDGSLAQFNSAEEVARPLKDWLLSFGKRSSHNQR